MFNLDLHTIVFMYLCNYLVFSPIPPLGLTLWINHQRPSPSTGYNDCIVNGETVRGKSSNIPCSDDNRFPKCRNQRKILSTGNAKFCA